MPELAEVEIVRRNLESWWTTPATRIQLLDEAVLTHGSPELLNELLLGAAPRMDRRGKYLIARFPAGRALIFHFRMTGKIVNSPEPEVRFARLAWDVGDNWLVFKDSRRLGHVEAFDTGELEFYEPLLKMGPEPRDLDAEVLHARLSPRRRLKDALLDQSVVAGVGNIAISEVFWRLRLPTDVRVKDLGVEQIAALAHELPKYFDELIATEMDEEVIYLGEGKAENPFDVYGHEGEPCPRCDEPLARTVVGGRSSFFCPACQGG